jgi:AmmeMemoRadiSam system protein B
MSLVFAAITPHPPMLIPAIGKDQLQALGETKAAMEQLEQDLYLAKPQVIIIISPHGSLFPDAFAINAHTHVATHFEQFGDLATKKEWRGAPELAARVSAAAKRAEIPVQLTSQPALDHGASVPLWYLTSHLPEVKVLPIGYSSLPADAHIRYGEIIKEIIMDDDRRIAVIASGDLSHVDEKSAAASIDAELLNLLEVRNTAGIVQIDGERVAAAHECGYRSILILLGMLKNMSYTFRTHSYEAPFGVGYLVGNFVL